MKGKIIGVLLLLPTLPHLVFAQCHLRNTWPIAEELFAGGFLIAAILLARAISKHPRALPPLPMWKAALPFASLSLLAGALAAVDGIAFARAAVFFTAKEHTRTTATVETSRPMRGAAQASSSSIQPSRHPSLPAHQSTVLRQGPATASS
ncbi:hypothetical protein ACKZDW_17405 [Ralstonia syzygii subsp. celebesensis]|uniref:hypothetical protein n=1 Tax=Ralstonia syzygii TaxID=28097 RepID=UPI00387E0DD6